ncbi:MAG: helix-turn-helix transcriptional regulator [Candidatus Lokiarchaeota archaeon]|nr:helix-turn-helix transcriptional regulator [Candidatus Lokiarchaeota archaeon]
MKTKALINPKIITWARTSASINVADVAKRIRVKPAELLEIEQGKRDISFERLRTLAYYFKRPLEVFYLDKVPETKRVPDFRSGPATVELTRKALDHLRYIKDMKNTITELGEIVGIKPTLDYTNLFTIQDGS